MPSHSPLLHLRTFPCLVHMRLNSVGECVFMQLRNTPYFSAVEHPDFVQSLLGCHGAGDWAPSGCSVHRGHFPGCFMVSSHDLNLCCWASVLNIMTGKMSHTQKKGAVVVDVLLQWTKETFPMLFHGREDLEQLGLYFQFFSSSSRNR